MTTRVYSWSAEGSNETEITVDLSERLPHPGNVLIACAAFSKNGGGLGALIAPQGWTEIYNEAEGSTSVATWIRTATREGFEGSTVTFATDTAQNANCVALIVEMDQAAVQASLYDSAQDITGLSTPALVQNTGTLTATRILAPRYSFIYGEGDIWAARNILPDGDMIVSDTIEGASNTDPNLSFGLLNALPGEETSYDWTAYGNTVDGPSYANVLVPNFALPTIKALASTYKRKRGHLYRRKYEFGTNVVTPAATGIFTLAQAKEWIRVDDCGGSHPDDDLIDLLIQAVTDELIGPDGILGRDIHRTSRRMTLDGFPPGAQPIRLPFTSPREPGLITTGPVYYIDSAGATQVFTEFEVLTNEDPNILVPERGSCWPTDVALQPRAVELVYEAGYDSEHIPETVLKWAKTRLGTYYNFREDVLAGIKPERVPYLDAVLEPFRARWFHPFEE